ncbi:alpha-2,8-polysialyltransferase family protein [Candidatus Symbiopectobacterium endolongispinus]|uniref:alpha-2,8-polysialyltransferase family protein n=1 Tax=Candidatus Symbiopectobacterium endolongispinus TaxID=2812664 RepID=UPI002079E301|nr:alpha-2,8-polysialyltransferase family protein [Candidatus Symbiopectobacterium endolongispinus]MBT9429735.1 hypothetical protein [Candidatus Symbiopectobacterium endolongispinus]
MRFTLQKFKLFFSGINYLFNIATLRKHEKDIEAFYYNNQVSDVFVHYPLHEKDSLYVKVARRAGITINFYEEGSCFYTNTRGRKRGVINQIKYWVEHISLMCLGIRRGYHVKLDYWYSIFPLNNKNNKIINIVYEGVDEPSVKYLFLLRPVTLDFPSITFKQQLDAMLVFVNRVPEHEKLYIKFHPCESIEMRNQVIENLRDICNKSIAIEPYEKEIAAEEIVSSMVEGGEVCGFGSSTPIYGFSINKKITYSSVLERVYKYDNINELSNLYFVYKKAFHILNLFKHHCV